MKLVTLIIAAFALLIAPLSPAHAGSGSFWGTVLGGAIGGHIGSTIGKGSGNLAATAAGTFVGAGIGNSIGHSLDQADRYQNTSPQYTTYYIPTPDYDLPNYVAPVSIERYDEDADEDYSIDDYGPPQAAHVQQGYMGSDQPHHRREGRQCREYTQTVRIGDEIQESYGYACLRPDGSWQIQEQ